MLYKDKLSEPHNNISLEEIDKFDALAHEWRNPSGRFATVIDFNALRLGYILNEIHDHFGDEKVSVLDVGCGAGLLAQPLADAGHEVLGIDASSVNIQVARQHGQDLPNLTYRHALTHHLLKEKKQFGVVLNTEVVEHVPEPQELLKDCGRLVSSGGMMITATLNRTWQSYLIGIVGAEYILRALPIGTHKWRSFVTPEEVKKALEPIGFMFGKAQGMSYHPIKNEWHLAKKASVNYLIPAFKLI